MRFLSAIRTVADTIERYTDEGVEYDFGFDVAQKITFVLTLMILWCLPWSWGEYEFAMFVFCCIVGRAVVMSNLHLWINEAIENRGGRKSTKRFLNMSSGLWKLIVLGVLLYLTIHGLIQERSFGDVLIALPCYIAMFICGFFIFGGVTNLASRPSNPNEVGSKAWREANGVVKVNRDLTNPLYRDRYGNYYSGTGFVPVPPPVNIVDKHNRQ